MKLAIIKSFGKNVSRLIITGNKVNAKLLGYNFFLHKMNIKFNMLFFFYDTLDCWPSQWHLSCHTKIIGILDNLKCNSNNKACIHMISVVTKAKARYFDSVLDLETTCYFLDIHDTRLEPRNTA